MVMPRGDESDHEIMIVWVCRRAPSLEKWLVAQVRDWPLPRCDPCVSIVIGPRKAKLRAPHEVSACVWVAVAFALVYGVWVDLLWCS